MKCGRYYNLVSTCASDRENGIISNNTSDLLTGTPSAMHAREGTAADVNGDGIKDFISANHGEDQGHNREANTLLLSNTNGKLVVWNNLVRRAPSHNFKLIEDITTLLKENRLATYYGSIEVYEVK